MKYLIPILLLSSCSSLPSMPSVPSTTSATVPSTAVGQVMKDTTDNIWQWVLISVVLVFCFPSMRAPLVGFLTALFTCLSLGPNHIIYLYNQKFKKDAKEERKE